MRKGATLSTYFLNDPRTCMFRCLIKNVSYIATSSVVGKQSRLMSKLVYKEGVHIIICIQHVRQQHDLCANKITVTTIESVGILVRLGPRSSESLV